MVHHGIDIAGADEECKAGLAEAFEIFRTVPIRLGNDAHRVAVAFKHPADDGRAKARVIHIRIPDDIHKIKLFNVPFTQFRCAHGHEA